MVPEFRVEEQSLRRNAAHMQASAAEIRVLLDQRSLQAVLSSANGGGVSGGAAADDGDIVNCVRQSRAPLWKMDAPVQTNDSRTAEQNAKCQISRRCQISRKC